MIVSHSRRRALRLGVRQKCRGLTLLELILALGLSVVLLGLIAVAINFQARALDLKRAEVEEAEIARAVLRHIEGDLRGAVWSYEAADFGAVTDLAGASGIDASALDPSALEGFDPDNPDLDSLSGAVGGEEEEANPNTSDIAASAQPPAKSGIYGNRSELQIDVSRLPRIDEYEATLAMGDEFTQIPSDVKSVAYYLRPGAAEEPTVGAAPLATASQDQRGGLVRRERDRAVTLYAGENGDPSDTAGDLLAPEVTRLEFRYFDGTDWVEEWDSTALGGLPVAVEIGVAIRRADSQANDSNVQFGGDLSTVTEEELVFRLLVRIPTATPLEDVEAAAPIEEEAADPSTSGGF